MRNDRGQVLAPTYESVCAGDGHTEAIRIEWNPQVTSYDRLLRVFRRKYRGGSLFHTQYKAAIWFHDEEQRKKAMSLKRRVTVVWVFWMCLSILGCICTLLVWTRVERYLSLLWVPVALVLYPGQLHVLPSCPWYDAEAMHQKCLAKNAKQKENQRH